jgi:type 2 lantibiotic biosynthesis protein LanM
MEAFFENLMVHAATVDELLSDAFEPVPGGKDDAERAAGRLAAWCRAATNGDWSLFERRLQRDDLSVDGVLARFTAVRRKSPTAPEWLSDAIWIETALARPHHEVVVEIGAEPCAFEQLLTPVVEQADALLWGAVAARTRENLNPSACACLRFALLRELSALVAPAVYQQFADARVAGTAYQPFVAAMKAGGFRQLFTDKPILLRLMAVVTRQWIDTSRELVARLDADLPAIRRELLRTDTGSRVVWLDDRLSDPHDHGHTVAVLTFDDGARVVYKPKDLRLDVAWYGLVARLNGADAPIDLRAVRAIARDGYGWTEFVVNSECVDTQGGQRFFRRTGAWLALFHCFAGTDMHHENMIAAADHPVPIDLEMALQAPTDHSASKDDPVQAFQAAADIVGDSVMAVGLIPSYGKSPDNDIFAIGGVTADRAPRITLAWNNINTDAMRPAKVRDAGMAVPNLPRIEGHSAGLDEHLDDFVGGFRDYARFLTGLDGGILNAFGGVSIRAVVRPTRFYGMLLQRLRDHRSMDDGIGWSAQADFVARLADWEADADPLWPLQRAERAALVELNVPRFVVPSDGHTIGDAEGTVVRTNSISGLDRARARLVALDEDEIAWQVEVIRQSVVTASRTAELPRSAVPQRLLRIDASSEPTPQNFVDHADAIANELAGHAIRDGSGAAWIGLDWLGDSEVAQLVPLGADLYNGAGGIAVFLAAHGAVAGSDSSAELARDALCALRKEIRGHNAARLARSRGIGGGTGVGSMVYAMALVSELLADRDLLAEAHVAAELITDDLIEADRQLDVMGGAAGAILALLRLFRQSGSADALERAIGCGRHLLAQDRDGPRGLRSWKGQGPGSRPLNGLSHGAAGFAYALSALASVTGIGEFAGAAAECVAFENSTYDPGRSNWPDVRFDPDLHWPCQWCHGACGIGLARIAMINHGAADSATLLKDLESALIGTERGWPGKSDILCCGTLGNIELFDEAGAVLKRDDLRQSASRRLTAVLDNAAGAGDFRWTGGSRRFNLGLFRGLAGVGYTALRRVDDSLPNVLIWE